MPAACNQTPLFDENDSHFQGWMELNQVNSETHTGTYNHKRHKKDHKRHKKESLFCAFCVRSPICRARLEWIVRHCHRTPHMSDRAAVVPESFLRVFEVAADDFDKRIDFHDHSRLEGIQV